MIKIGLGGSCHWCTEAIFSSLKGVADVQQGWISADGDNLPFSEAVIVEFDPDVIELRTLIAVHLSSHSCTSNHSMRSKYRSAIYTFNNNQFETIKDIIKELQNDYPDPIITKVLTYKEFRLNSPNYLNYYFSNPDKPFCENIINPKLKRLMELFEKDIDTTKLRHLQ